MFTLCNAITQNGQSNLSTQTFNVWDVLSVVVAFIAIIVAVCVAVAQSLSGRKERQAALEAEYFRRIYSEHLLKLIPSARQAISFDSNSNLAGCSAILEELNTLRRDSVYFQYQDPKFYSHLKTELQTLEDFITNSLNHQHIGEDQTTFNSKVCSDLTKIYKTISRRYYGEKAK